MGTIVKTKYNIGDRVWYISDNKVLSSDITGFHILVSSNREYKVEYTLHYSDSWINEDRLYKTKKELLESL